MNYSWSEVKEGLREHEYDGKSVDREISFSLCIDLPLEPYSPDSIELWQIIEPQILEGLHISPSPEKLAVEANIEREVNGEFDSSGINTRANWSFSFSKDFPRGKVLDLKIRKGSVYFDLKILMDVFVYSTAAIAAYGSIHASFSRILDDIKRSPTLRLFLERKKLETEPSIIVTEFHFPEEMKNFDMLKSEKNRYLETD